MMPDSPVVRALKAVRVSQPFNAIATGLVRSTLRTLGVNPSFVTRHLHRAGVTRCPLPNGRTLSLWSRGDDWISNQLFWRGFEGYEAETVPLFFDLARSASVCLDIGAHIGYYTLLAAHANPAGRVFALEPHPRIFERLRRNVMLNCVGNVECIPVAASDHAGRALLFHNTTAIPSNSSLAVQTEPGSRPESVEVDVVTLDEFVRSRAISRVDLVKLDTEATEPAILRGMRETLARDRPSLVCEVLPGFGCEQPLHELLAPLGYRYYHLSRRGPVLRSAILGEPDAYNYLFTTSTLRMPA